MKTSIGQMDGNGWEEYCQVLLRAHYVDYQEVPAQFGGDYGIEGFTRSGIVFQCYCPPEDPSGIDLYEKQRDKITDDINKLIKNSSKISRLGAGIIKEWHFLTPRYNNKELVNHCRSKESEVHDKNLSTVSDNFIICIKTDQDFLPERQIFLGTTRSRVPPTSEVPTSDSLDEFLESDNEIVQNIKKKITKLWLPSEEQSLLTKQLVEGYVVGQHELEILNQRFPAIYESILQLKSAKQSQLQMQMLSEPNNPGKMLNIILKEYEGKLETDFSKSLNSALIARLSTEAISDWLGRCPLNFLDLEGNDGGN